MSKRIPLTQGKVAIVDDADFLWLNEHKWHVTIHSSRCYAVRHAKDNGRRSKVYMHRVILDPLFNKDTDHINGDGLDNRRRNLRACTRSQNQMNKRKGPGCSSKYKGVNWDKRHHKWQVQIGRRDERQHLGYFDDEREAAGTYNVEARELFGKFAKVNIIEEETCRN